MRDAGVNAALHLIGPVCRKRNRDCLSLGRGASRATVSRRAVADRGLLGGPGRLSGVEHRSVEAGILPSNSRLVGLYSPTLGQGGAERVVLNLANAMVGLRTRVDVLIVNRKCSDYLDALSANVRVVDLDAARAVWCLGRLVRYMRKERPQALLSVALRGHALLLAARAMAGVDTVCAASVHNTHSREYSTSIPLKHRLTLHSMRWVLPRMDRVIAVSDGVRQDLVANFGLASDSVQVIHNPIVTSDIDERAAESVDDPWLDGFGPPVLLAVGRLTRQKNFALLLRAVRRVRDTVPVRLLILGRGEERQRLGRLARELGLGECVRFKGFVSNPFAFMKRARMLVLSSDWEGFGNVLVEALAVGCPVVSTDCPSGPREILADGRCGRLVPTNNVTALAAAIVEELATQPDRELLRSRAESFDAARIASRYLSVLSRDPVGLG